MREGETFRLFSFLMMILSVIITLCFYDGFYLPSVVLLLPWDGPTEFVTELMGDVIAAVKSFLPNTMRAEVVIHPAYVLLFSSSNLLLGEGPSFTVSEAAPRHPGRY